MKRLINKILFGLTLTGGSLGLHSCGDWLDINSNELAATKTEAGYLFNYAAINYSSKRVGGDQWLPIIYAAQVASDADNWFVGADMYNISTYAKVGKRLLKQHARSTKGSLAFFGNRGFLGSVQQTHFGKLKAFQRLWGCNIRCLFSNRLNNLALRGQRLVPLI